MVSICPYCLERPSDTKDHIFSRFLGGTKTIPCCKRCNNRFGDTFEGTVSKQLAPIIVLLTLCGYKHKSTVVYKGAWIDEESGITYDLDTERHSYPTKPYLYRENDEITKVVARSEAEGRRIAASLIAKGKGVQYVYKEDVRKGIRPPLRNLRINIGQELRQLAVKMCVAVGQKVKSELILLDSECRNFLLADSPKSSPVRIMASRENDLKKLRPL